MKKVQADVQEAAENNFVENSVVVSDYAIAQGAGYLQPTGDEVLDHYHWMERAAVPEVYHEGADGRIVPNFYDQAVGLPMVFPYADLESLSIQGGYLTYRDKRPRPEDEKDEYVYYPQKRVDDELAKRLTLLASGKVRVPSSEFGNLSYTVPLNIYENHHGVENQSYYYQGQAYCVRLCPNATTDRVQWFELRPIMAERVDDKIVSKDVLLADNFFQGSRVLNGLQKSVALNHEIPAFYTKTPFPKIIDDDDNTMQR